MISRPLNVSHKSGAMGRQAPYEARLKQIGLERLETDGGIYRAEAAFSGPLDNPELDERLRVRAYRIPAAQPAEKWMYIPAVFSLGFVYWSQGKRRKRI